MNYRTLGATGLRVSEIGFGAWGLGGASGGAVAYGPTNDEESRAALRAALETGINFFDTSDLYGFGHSEKLLGEVFQNCRDQVIFASKAGFVEGERQDFSPKHLDAALHNSLQRLRTDYLDLFQLHSPPLDILKDREITGQLEAFRAAGKIRAWGLSARSPEEAQIAVEQFAVPCLQVNFNLTDQRAAKNGLFDLCRRQKTGVIVRTPLCFGFLTGRYSEVQTFDPQDHRSRWPAEQVRRWQQANDSFQFLFSSNPADTAAQVALRFCLSFEGVDRILGMLTEANVRENAAASQRGPLPADLLRQSADVYAAARFFVRAGE